jgi:hypothetical protein
VSGFGFCAGFTAFGAEEAAVTDWVFPEKIFLYS